MKLDAKQRAAQDQFDRQSDRYGRSHILADTSDLDASIAGIEMPAAGLALDIATGGGHAALWLARRGYRVVLSDVSERMLRNALALLESEGFHAEYRQHPGEALPYPRAHFDVITCRVAAHHFSDVSSFVGEASRVLRPGGAFVLIDGTVPDSDPEGARWMNALEKLRDTSHGRFLSPNEWRRTCHGAGLDVRRAFVTEFKQPDLEWYFDTANTPPANRDSVRNMLGSAPDAVRRIYRIETENGRTVWWWNRLHLVAQKTL